MDTALLNKLMIKTFCNCTVTFSKNFTDYSAKGVLEVMKGNGRDAALNNDIIVKRGDYVLEIITDDIAESELQRGDFISVGGTDFKIIETPLDLEGITQLVLKK